MPSQKPLTLRLSRNEIYVDECLLRNISLVIEDVYFAVQTYNTLTHEWHIRFSATAEPNSYHSIITRSYRIAKGHFTTLLGLNDCRLKYTVVPNSEYTILIKGTII